MLDKRRVRESFSRAAATYDAASSLQRETARTLAAAFCASLENGFRVKRVLDLGSGTGHLAAALKALLPGLWCCLADIASPMLLRAREKFPAGEAALVTADTEALPFGDGLFDAVLSNLAFQWLTDTGAAFSEAWRVLRPGGYFQFTTLGPGTLAELRDSIEGVTSSRLPGRRLRLVPFRKVEELAADLSSSGFTIVEKEERAEARVYESPIELVRTLKYIGALDRGNICAAPTLVKGSLLRQAFTEYEKNFYARGGIRATYNIISITASKG